MADNVPAAAHFCHHLRNPILALLASSSTMPRRVMGQNNLPTCHHLPRPPVVIPTENQPYPHGYDLAHVWPT